MDEDDERRFQAEMKVYLDAKAEENRREKLFDMAVHTLADEDWRWHANAVCFRRWNANQRFVWMNKIEAQSAQGLPMAQQLMAKVIALRMGG